MPTAENAILYYEAGQDLVSMVALTDSGDATTFESADDFWSNRDGYAPDVRPNGLITGGVVTPAASKTNNYVDVSNLTCYLAGVETTVDSGNTDIECARPAGSGDDCKINSITVTSEGAIAVVPGADHTDLSATRGDDGGPPWIPTGSIEIAQVKYTSDSDGLVTADEIYQVVGTHTERWDYPAWNENRVSVESQVLGNAGITFLSALPLIHSSDGGSSTATKAVYAEYYDVLWAELPNAENFVPPENSHSVSSKQVYGNTLGASSSSLGQGSFTFYATDGVTDNLIKLKDEILWFKFMPNRYKDAYVICQGKLGISRTFPAGDNIAVACTISAEEIAEDVAS
jgi:hypothetical protein